MSAILSGFRPLRSVCTPECVRVFAVLYALLLPVGLAVPGVLGAAEQLPTGPTNRGIVSIEPYQIFPELRHDNAVYLNNTLLFSVEHETLLDLQPLTREGRFVYLAADAQDTLRLGVRVAKPDPEPRITEVAPGIFHAVMVLDGVVFKKIYRILERRIVDLLPRFKTADGAVGGPGGVVFYHVATAQEGSELADPQNRFGLRLHLAVFTEERLLQLDYPVNNGLPHLKLSWIDETRIQYDLANGRSEIISISQFR